MRTATGDIHLTRVNGLLEGVEKSLEEFHAKVKAHEQALAETSDADVGSFVSGLASAVMNKNRLGRDKSALLADLDLADKELDLAESAEPMNGDIARLRTAARMQRGQIELVSGKLDVARQHFDSANAVAETAYAHYMLGLIDEDAYRPQDALRHFERSLELDPIGEYSVAALREANAMRSYKKRFRGSWTTLLVLLLFWPAAVIYFFVKRK